jgi:hypothetical protein
MSNARHALIIRPDSSFTIIDWNADSPDGLEVLYREIDAPTVTAVDISTDVTMWLDDEGIINGSAVNWAASALYATYAPLHQLYYGTAVFTGIDIRNGDTIGLTGERCIDLLKRAGIGMLKIPHPRTK